MDKRCAAITPLETLESMFSDGESQQSHVFECSKLSLPVFFEIPLGNGALRTLETIQEYLGRTDTSGGNFHVLVSSSATPRYPVLASVFLEKYTNIASENCSGDSIEFLCRPDIVLGTATPRSLPVKALCAPFSGKLATSWGSVLPFCDESILVRYNENDFAVVDPIVFNSTYKIHPEKINMRIKFFSTSDSLLEICFYDVTYNGVCPPSVVETEIVLQVANLSGIDASNIFLLANCAPLKSLYVPPRQTTGDILGKLNFLAMGVVTSMSPFKNRRLRVKWPAIKELLNSPIDNDEFPDLICSTHFFLGYRACSTPDLLVSIDVHNVTKMHCTQCSMRVKRGKIQSFCN